jgi:hypothetical protein
VFVSLISVAVFAVSAGDSPAASRHRTRGEALFFGDEPLRGAIRGHRSGLPPEVVTCANCHDVGSRARAPGASPAPRLDRSLLVEARVRRGGPPSSYDPETFCRLVRTGVDPVYVLIAREMPVYVVDDAQCASLWQFLTSEARRPHGGK